MSPAWAIDRGTWHFARAVLFGANDDGDGDGGDDGDGGSDGDGDGGGDVRYSYFKVMLRVGTAQLLRRMNVMHRYSSTEESRVLVVQRQG